MTFLRSLFGKSPRQKNQITPKNTDHIIQAYSRILQTSAPKAGCVADTSELPFPKEDIKKALIAALKKNSDPNMREALKIAFIHLSNWQRGVGEKHQGLDLAQIGYDPSRDSDPEALAHVILKQSEDSEKWIKLMQEEEAELVRQLQALGLW